MIVNFVQKLLVFTKLDWTGNFTKVKRTLISAESSLTGWIILHANKVLNKQIERQGRHPSGRSVLG